MASSKFQLPEIALIDLLGQEDKNLRRIETDLQGLKIQNRGHDFTLTGEDQAGSGWPSGAY